MYRKQAIKQKNYLKNVMITYCCLQCYSQIQQSNQQVCPFS